MLTPLNLIFLISLLSAVSAFRERKRLVRGGRDYKINPLLFITASMVLIFGGRESGVDYENYRLAFQMGFQGGVTDFGFQLISATLPEGWRAIEIFYYLSSTLLLLNVALINRRFGSRVAAYYIVLYFAHLFIVRELSQTRVGIASQLLLIAYLLRDNKGATFALISGLLFHISVLPLALLIGAFRFVKNLRVKLFIVSSSVVAILLLWDTAVSFFPKASYYMTVDAEGYGAPVSDMNQLIFSACLMLAFIIPLRGLAFDRFKQQLVMDHAFFAMLGSVFFLALDDYSILASRLNNVMLFFYPLPLAIIFSTLHRRLPVKLGIFVPVVVLILGAILFIIRPQNLGIVKAINF